MEEYESVWEHFVLEQRLEFGGHKDPAWQDGHRLSASLIIPGHASRFHERLEPLREALRPFPFVSLHPDHFVHITLILLGFLVEEPEEENEISRERLREIEDRAGSALSDFPAFNVELANLNAFPGAILDLPGPRRPESATRAHLSHCTLQRLAHRRAHGGERRDDVARPPFGLSRAEDACPDEAGRESWLIPGGCRRRDGVRDSHVRHSQRATRF
jgi:2'-5' RNA ligase